MIEGAPGRRCPRCGHAAGRHPYDYRTQSYSCTVGIGLSPSCIECAATQDKLLNSLARNP